MTPFIRLTRSIDNDAIAILTIDRPPRNAMSLEAYRQLLAGLQESSADSSIQCLILTGAGDKAFVSGGDLNEHLQLDAESAQLRTALIRQVFDAVTKHRSPVIGAVNGYALGGGLALAACCDVVVASETAKFGLPEVKVGIMGGTRHLRRIMPEQIVRWMALTGTVVDAKTFQRMGGVQGVVPADELMAAATKIAQSICVHSPTAVRLMKEALNLTENMDLEAGYQVECLATSIMKASPDGKEAVQAIVEKRPPVFQQR